MTAKPLPDLREVFWLPCLKTGPCPCPARCQWVAPVPRPVEDVE